MKEEKENNQTLSQNDLSALIENMGTEGEKQDEETPAVAPDKTDETEEEKANKGKDIPPETVDVPDEDKTEDKAGNEEENQTLSQDDLSALIENMGTEGEKQDEETPAVAPDKTDETEEEKANKGKDIPPETVDVPDEDKTSDNKDEGVKTKNQDEAAEIDESGDDKKEEVSLSETEVPDDEDDELKSGEKVEITEADEKESSKKEEEITETDERKVKKEKDILPGKADLPDKDKEPEKEAEDEKSVKNRKRFRPLMIGGLVAMLLIAGLSVFFIYAGKSKPELKETQELSSPEQPGKSLSKPQQEINKPEDNNPAEIKLAKIADLIQGLQNKQNAIADLKQQYQEGIDESENEILEKIHSKKTITYKDAMKEKRIELCLRSVQRRQVYIEELNQLLDQLVLDTEELIYQKRKIEIDMLMVNVLKDMNMERLDKRIDIINQLHIHDNEKLTIDTKDARHQPLNEIWEKIYDSRGKKPYLSKEARKNREILKEICNGNFSRKHELTALSPDAAKALSEWKGKDLFLTKLARLSPEEAKFLSKWKGRWLSLNGLIKLTPGAAIHLSKWQGNRLSLNGLKKISPEVVEYLSQWGGEDLELVNLKNISKWEESGKKIHLPDS